MSATDSSPERYFHAIEEAFIRLRGAPLLLSPTDWHVARGWYEEGVPLDLVGRVMEEVFGRLRERDPDRKIQSLRYCAPAVETAWHEVRDLESAAGRQEPIPLDVPRRLQTLAAALPVDLPGRNPLVRRVEGLEGSAEEVEEQLQGVEREFLSAAVAGLDAEQGAQLEARVVNAVERTRSRISAEEMGELEARLRREFLRQDLAMPALSLFVEPRPADG